MNTANDKDFPKIDDEYDPGEHCEQIYVKEEFSLLPDDEQLGDYMAGSSTSEDTKTTENRTLNLLPEKSKKLYQKTYGDFLDWMKEKKTNSFSETVLLQYFTELSSTRIPSTLWSKYSMLKATLYAEKRINIGLYSKLRTFLKRNSVGFKSKKAKIFSSDEINNFLTQAPDEIYLATKIATILGISGACRRSELCNLTVKDISEQGSVLIINLPKNKNNISRTATIQGHSCELVKKYLQLRPPNTTTDRFFLTLRKGKCIAEPIGINKIGKMPQEIAEWLKLPEPKQYTGHSFRKTSASLFTDRLS